MHGKRVLVIGAGPAGLTAAYELLRAGAGYRVTLVEADAQVGGISKTVNYRGNRIDLGGHRFFSKSEWVMDWWRTMLPIQADGAAADGALELGYRNRRHRIAAEAEAAVPADGDAVMLVRRRLSRIYFAGQFFSYPIQASLDTALKLGPVRLARILASYARARAVPIQPERSLEDFLVNRFGRELYRTFFADYTHKVWGVGCAEMPADWGAQRIKGLSIARALLHILRSPLRKFTGGLPGGASETSLVERFLYPKYGPGQMWETVAKRAEALGAEVRLGSRAIGLTRDPDTGRIIDVDVLDIASGHRETLAADFVISTMPVSELIGSLTPAAPPEVCRIAGALHYRDFITVGLLLRKLRRTAGAGRGTANNLVPDNWIYIQEPGVTVGRLQFFNNWSPAMVADPETVWLGMEYFCQEGDTLWSLPDAELIAFASGELEQIGLADRAAILDGTVLRVPKAYPGYHGAYAEFATVRAFTDSISNLFLIGRNGMHRYNNQDHSMLTGRYAAEAILTGRGDRDAIWGVNIDDDYHEERR